MEAVGGFGRLLRLWLENLGQNAGARRCIRLPHDVFDVLFDRLLGNAELVGDFLIRPALRQMLHHGMLPFRELEALFGLFGRRLFSSSDFTEGDIEKAQELLDGLRPESPLRHRLSGELDELRKLAVAKS